MCVVSQVMDYGRDQFPGMTPFQPFQPFQPPPATPLPPLNPDDILRDLDLGGVKKKAQQKVEGRLPTKEEIEAFLKLVKAAEEFDKRANQPHCEDPEKIKFLHAMERRLAELEKKIDQIAAAVVPEAQPVALYGSSILATNFTIGDRTYSLGDIVRMAFEESGLSPEDWNDLAEVDRDNRLLSTLVSLRAQNEG